MNRYTGIFTRDKDDGGWVAQCAELPSAITQGETITEAKANLKQAIKFMLSVEVKMSLKKAGRQARVQKIVHEAKGVATILVSPQNSVSTLNVP